MAIAYLPIITEQNYAPFRRILQDAPATCKEWLHILAIKAVVLSSKGWRVER